MASSSVISSLSSSRTPGWMFSHSDDLLTSDLSIWINTSHVFTSNWSIFLTCLLQRMHQNWEWDSFCCKKQLKEFTLRFLHLLQLLLHLGHCLVPLTIRWLPASGAFTNFSTLSYSILCKALFTFFLAFLISHLKLTCHFYRFSCSSNSGDFWTALFSFWIVAQFLLMHPTAFRFLLDFLFFIIFEGELLELKYVKPQKIPASDWTAYTIEYMIIVQPITSGISKIHSL